jgi:hypothetical protein
LKFLGRNISKLRKLGIATTKIVACFTFLIVSSAFQAEEELRLEDKLPTKTNENDGKRLVTLHSLEFDAFADRINRQLSYENGFDTIPSRLLTHALRGYLFLKHTQELNEDRYLTVIDFSKFCNKKRLWVIDIQTKKVLFNELVAHGVKTGEDFAKYFSNQHNSNKSSLGFYTTGGTYSGSNNYSLKLNGLEPKFNSNAFARGIVIHGANYVDPQIVMRKERIGRSFGCPAVSQKINKPLINTIKGGSCLFIFHPTTDYLENSKLLNANLYVTVDDLSI